MKNISNEKMNNRKGMTLVMLVVTIVVMIILLTVVVAGVVTLTTNGKKAAFANDLKSVQDAVEVYYSDNSVLPKVELETSYILNTLKSLAGDSATELEVEVISNGDNLAIFYEVDLDKINSSKGLIGRKTNGSNDVFVVSSKNLKVYYVKGYSIGTNTYFSITQNLTGSTSISRVAEDTSTVAAVETDGIKIVKDNKNLTNSLTVTVTTTALAGETISYTITGVVPESPVTITSGVATAIPLNSTTITGATLDAFNNMAIANRNIIVYKKNVGGTVLASATMSLSNLDIQIGTVPVPTVKAYTSSNFLTFSSQEVKDIRYEYVTKKDSSGTIVNYYTVPPTIDKAYMLATAKKQVGTYISIPKNIKSLVVCILDSSGNISEISTITIADVNIVAEAKINTKDGVVLSKEIVKSTTNVISKDAGTVEAWVEVDSTLRLEVAEKTIFSTYADEKFTNSIILRHTRYNTWEAIMSSDIPNISILTVADTLSYGKHLFSIKWSSTEFSLFIDGVRVATTATPKLMAAVPTNFNIGSGPRLNLVKNGYVTEGSNTNLGAMIYTTEDSFSPGGAVKSLGSKGTFSNEYIPINPKNRHYQSGYFKAMKVPSTTINYYGIQTFDSDKNFIDATMTNNYIATRTELTQDLKPGDTIAYVKSAVGWKVLADSSGLKAFGIYNDKYDNNYRYTRNYKNFSTSDPIANTVTLSAAYSGTLIKAGTKVANNAGMYGSFTYNVISGQAVPNTWTKYSSYIQGETGPLQTAWNQFRNETKYVTICMLINYNNIATDDILLDDIEFIDLTYTLWNTKIEDLVISNTARTDSDILSRYKNGSLAIDSSVTYSLNEN